MAGPASAGQARILRVTYIINPTVVDVTVDGLTFDASVGGITVTGTVRCDSAFDVFVLDFTATQGRVSAPAVAFDLPCKGTFSQVITAPVGTFRPGRVTVEINALACGPQCGEEALLVEAVLVPDRGR